LGGWVGGEKSKLKLNSAQLELELGLSLAIKPIVVKKCSKFLNLINKF
jgi:hypothetical protein